MNPDCDLMILRETFFHSNTRNNLYKLSIVSLFFSVRCIQINLQFAFIAVFLSFSSSPIKINFVMGNENLSEIICNPLQFGFLNPATEDET